MIYKIATSYITTFILLSILAIGAAIGTFIENDFGSARAKELVYTSLWYQFTLLFSSLHLLAVIYKTKMWKVKARFLFHISFIIILIGASMTYIFGIDATMTISEGKKSNIIVANHKELIIPFEIELIDFELTRYPGSRSPSEFSSKVRIIDTLNNSNFQTVISMNNTLLYRGYKFFQTSYSDDESATVLSVNKDPGVEVTYIGYALLFFSLIATLFDKKSRFQYLLKKLKNTPTTLLILVLLSIQAPLYSKDDNKEYIQDYLQEHKKNSYALSEKFGSLVVQGPDGRMKPLDTQNREILNKLTSKETWNGMSANQVILGMFARPSIWKKVDIIKVKTSKLKEILGVSETNKYVKFTDFFDKKGNYKLTQYVEEANQKVPSRRGTFDRDLIKVDERLNIIFMSYRGVLLNIFPLPNSDENKWLAFKEMFSSVDDSKIKRSMSKLLDNTYNRNYENSFTYINDIKEYQNKHSAHIIPSNLRLNVELWYNKMDLFFKLSLVYLVLGLVLLIYSLSTIFYNSFKNSKIENSISWITLFLFFIHTCGIAVRWYIGGYAPISNTYETMIYISYSAILASVLFLRSSSIALSAAFLIAGVFIFAAYLGEIDPQITNLVPVLKSYWLSIHVSVITASYGFFGIAAILGSITLILFLFRSENRRHIDSHIQQISYINEIALIFGLILLVIGNFLGAIWANESWGRYWGWDPKETWAYISIIVYVMVLHLRLLKKIYSPYLFNVLSVVAFSSILMTYFGVNFYLAGMHSYATGDPVPIPEWAYITSVLVLVLIIISYPKKNLKEKNEKN